MSMTRPPNLMTLELLLAKGSKVRVKWALQIEGIDMAWHGTALGLKFVQVPLKRKVKQDIVC